MKTPISYYGGKQRMLHHICPLIPNHNLYCEPFAGGAAVFFAKEPAKVNVINDLNSELINFYRVIVSQPEEFRREVLQTLHSREQHKHAGYIYNNPDYFTEVQRAWAIWVLSKISYVSRLDNCFGYDKAEGRLPKKIENAKLVFTDELRELLEKATIECDDAFKVIKRYDTPATFHFIDPPYVGSNMGHYANMFNDQNLKELLELCETLQGKFMLTMYPNEDIQTFAERNGWVIHRVERQVSACAAAHRKKQEEWMVCNFTGCN
jgi:DNA adenine methylase